jgi:hypothetical protein
MVNVDLLWYLLIPFILTVITVFILRKYMDDITWGQSVGASAVGLLISGLIMWGAFTAGKGSKTADTEIWNGEITNKHRVEGSYVESYSCNCHTVCSGSGKNESCSQQCDTCYEDHYTVKWNCNSNIGNFTINSEDWTSRRVYSLPDPRRWTIINRGDPVAAARSYTNYIKAVPESLFRPTSSEVQAKFAGKIPPYPIDVYDFYHVDRVLPVGVSIPDLPYWNAKLSEALKKLGPAKEANAVIVITNIDDSNYYFALQDAWLNGKKNDIILVIGAPKFPAKAAWVRVMALTQEDMFQIKLRDEILALDSLTADNVIDTLSNVAYSNFKRKHMKDFAYLEAEIDPPGWVMALCVIFIVAAYAGFWFYTVRNGQFNRYGLPSFRKYNRRY